MLCTNLFSCSLDLESEVKNSDSLYDKGDHEMSVLLNKHTKLFTDGLGKFSKGEANIFIDESVKPVFCKARPLPYAIKDKVEKELDSMVEKEILSPVSYAEWAPPIVPIQKQNGGIRICGDFKVTVNKCSEKDKYPIPRIEDLYTKLAGGTVFSVLDLSMAYQQIVVNQRSRRYLTINTTRGLFTFNRLPAGICAAPGIFQRIMDGLFSNVEGVVCYLDDILVCGKDIYSADTEYNRNKLYMIYRKAKSIDKYKQKVFLNGNVLILENKRYSVDDLVDLPADLSPRLFSEKTNDKCYVFGGIHSKFNPFSNWYPCRIQHGGHLFKSVEQAYQHSKAAYVGDATSATKLLHTMDPAAAKKIGSKVAGVNGSNWDTAKNDIMKDLITKKFTDSDELKAELLATGNKAMVECGRDPYYACGLPIVHKDIFNQEKWTGKNVLGNILCTVRDIIRNG